MERVGRTVTLLMGLSDVPYLNALGLDRVVSPGNVIPL